MSTSKPTIVKSTLITLNTLKSLNNIRHKTRAALLAIVASITTSVFVSCNETSTIGSSLVEDKISVVVDTSFTIEGHSVYADAVLSRTIVQLIGVIDAPGYGYIKSDVVTQFMPANNLDTVGVTVNDIDSLKLVMLVSKESFVGDSLALLGMEVYPLIKSLEIPIYSNFNPDGYYDATRCLGSTVYNLTKASEPDSLQANNFYTLSLNLPVEMGRELFAEYVNNPSTFASPTAFAKFFPGLYIKNSYGSGRITRFGNTTMQMFYHKNIKLDSGRDTTYYSVGNYFAVTPEIITNNNIELRIADDITQRVVQGEAILLAPAGLEVELTFPAREIMAKFNAGTRDGLGVVNRLSMQLPVEALDNKYNISAQRDVLMVLKKDRDKFFINNNLPDNKTSFLTALSTQSDGSSAYVVSDMREYILDLMTKETITDDDITFVLVPVTATSETAGDYYGGSSSTITAIVPYVSEPKMAKILLEKAKINFVYSLQSTNY